METHQITAKCLNCDKEFNTRFFAIQDNRKQENFFCKKKCEREFLERALEEKNKSKK